MSSRLQPTNSDPCVINVDLLKDCVLQQCPNNDIKDLFSDSVDLEIVTTLRLDFLNILKIDHLWMMGSLTTLSIAHNRITAIENIETLTNLKHLDLSFNKISKIENIGTLIKLEVLMLNNNRIKNLESMDTLKNLMIFSISDNLLDDYEEIIYLRQFKNLRTLCIRDNPFCKEQDYTFIRAVLPQILYLNYIKITQQDRNDSAEKFKNLIKHLDEEDKLIEMTRIEQEKKKNLTELHFNSFVERTDGPELFVEMFKDDKDGFVLLSAGGELTIAYELYKKWYVDNMRDLIKYAHDQYYEREDEIKLYLDTVQQAKINYMNISRDDIEKHGLNETDDTKNVLWNKLMKDEITLNEKITETMDVFITNMDRMIENMMERVKTVFDAWKVKETEWIDSEMKFYNSVINGGVQIDSLEIKYLLNDPEVLKDIVRLSQTNHMNYIESREEYTLSRCRNWLHNLIDDLKSEEINRSRAKILEISNLNDIILTSVIID